MASTSDKSLYKLKAQDKIRAKLNALQRKKRMGKVKPLEVNKVRKGG